MIEWTAEQPWCDGNVGMIGESYLAWVQWFAAAPQPPHLKCIAPFDGGADMYRDINYHGGIMASASPHLVHVRRCAATISWATLRPNPTSPLGPAVERHPPPDLRRLLEERIPDFAKIQCPVFSIGILHKTGTHLRGNLRGYERADEPKKFMLCHGDFEGDEMAIFNSKEMRLLLLRWYDHWLKGNDTGMMEEARWRVFVRGQEIYRPEDEWPLPHTDYRRLFLKAGPSGAVESLNDGRLTWDEPTELRRSTTYSYPDPDWSHFSGVGTAVMERRYPPPLSKKILTFTSDPLPEDLDVIGNIVLVLYASSDQTDTDFLMRLWDQMPDAEQVPGCRRRAGC